MSLCASVTAPDLSVLLSSLSLFSDARDRFANHFLLRNPASTRSALGLLALCCFSASALLVLFCFFRFVQSSSPARESLAATRLPLEAAIQNKKIHFCVIRCHVQQTFIRHRYDYFFNIRQLFHTIFFVIEKTHEMLDFFLIFNQLKVVTIHYERWDAYYNN